MHILSFFTAKPVSVFLRAVFLRVFFHLSDKRILLLPFDSPALPGRQLDGSNRQAGKFRGLIRSGVSGLSAVV